MLAIGKITASLILLALTSGCAVVASTLSSIDTSAETEATNSASPTPGQPNETPQNPGVEPEACSQELQLQMEQTIDSQTKAFAKDEFELAYSYASPSFRASVSVQSFIAIIAGSYGPLITSSSLSFGDCLVDPDQSFGIIDVSFVQGGEDVYALRYLMVSTPDGWRVEGASNLEVVGKGT